MLSLVIAFVIGVVATGFPTTCDLAGSQLRNNFSTIGTCPGDFDIIGGQLVPVYEGIRAPTGVGVSSDGGVFLTYARNMEPQPWTLTKIVDFAHEIPWPSEAWQNCAPGQNASTCFVNVQNVILDDHNVFWVIDSGVPNGAAMPVDHGAKIMTFEPATGKLLRTYIYPKELFWARIQLNDLKINNTLGYAFITEDSYLGSISTLNIKDGTVHRHIYNTTFTKPDANFVSMYNGEPIRNWKGTKASYMTSGTNGIALTGGNVFWAIKSSHRYYYAPQTAFLNNASDSDIVKQIQNPGTFPSESAGYTADDRGRVYMMASEQNAILYIDTKQSETTEEINGVPAGGSGLVPAANLIHKTLLRSAQIQAADTAAIWNGWLYFTTNQQGLAPLRQYRNIDRRRGPFRSYKVYIGRGPAPA